jgi:hypothetical protein
MKVQQAIQSQANVIRVTSITAGDVYKRFEDNYDDRTYYGIVKNVHNDGEVTIIEATEYCYKYSSIDVSHKIIRGNKDINIFPSSPDELNLELEKARKELVRKIEKAQEEISTNEQIIKDVDGLISGETLKQLHAMGYKELSQSEYDTKKVEAGL